jgi:hypothetical protein
MSHKKIDNCIAACTDCVVEASHFINDCLKDSDVKILHGCIKLNQDCVAICLLAIQAMANDSAFTNKICKLCEEICTAVADEYDKYSHIKHAKSNVKACRQCADECGKMNKEKKEIKVDKGNL